MYLPIIAGIALITTEIIFDKWCWYQDPPKDDKPYSTIIRGVLLILFGLIVISITKDWYYSLWVTLCVGSVFFLLFDFVLNVVQWVYLPIPYYQPYDSKYRELRKNKYSVRRSKKLALESLTLWQKFVFKLQRFTKRFFWHGDENTTSWYDKAFQRIPPLMEILIKVTIFSITIYYLGWI